MNGRAPTEWKLEYKSKCGDLWQIIVITKKPDSSSSMYRHQLSYKKVSLLDIDSPFKRWNTMRSEKGHINDVRNLAQALINKIDWNEIRE